MKDMDMSTTKGEIQEQHTVSDREALDEVFGEINFTPESEVGGLEDEAIESALADGVSSTEEEADTEDEAVETEVSESPVEQPEPDVAEEDDEEEEDATTEDAEDEPELITATQVEILRQEVQNLRAALRQEYEKKQNMQNVAELLRFDPKNYITEEQYDEIIASPEKMNDLLNQAVQDGAIHAVNYMVGKMPSLVQPLLTSERELASIRNSFYSANPELVGHETEVQQALVYLSQRPEVQGYSEAQLQEVTATLAKRLVGVPAGKGAAKNAAPVKRPNGFVKKAARTGKAATTKSTRKRDKELSETAKDIQDIFG